MKSLSWLILYIFISLVLWARKVSRSFILKTNACATYNSYIYHFIGHIQGYQPEQNTHSIPTCVAILHVFYNICSACIRISINGEQNKKK